MIKKINNWIAVNLTLAFGTMWLTYAFFLYGFGPIFWPQQEAHLLYWSNTIQLWSLPLLMVGTNLLGQANEKRNADMYNMVQTELLEVKEILAEVHKLCCKEGVET